MTAPARDFCSAVPSLRDCPHQASGGSARRSDVSRGGRSSAKTGRRSCAGMQESGSARCGIALLRHHRLAAGACTADPSSLRLHARVSSQRAIAVSRRRDEFRSQCRPRGHGTWSPGADLVRLEPRSGQPLAVPRGSSPTRSGPLGRVLDRQAVRMCAMSVLPDRRCARPNMNGEYESNDSVVVRAASALVLAQA